MPLGLKAARGTWICSCECVCYVFICQTINVLLYETLFRGAGVMETTTGSDLISCFLIMLGILYL